jgi:excinuclease ABC subunit C
MKEIVYRRYHRMIVEQQALPNLIVIDGGKGQLSAAMESIYNLKTGTSGSGDFHCKND